MNRRDFWEMWHPGIKTSNKKMTNTKKQRSSSTESSSSSSSSQVSEDDHNTLDMINIKSNPESGGYLIAGEEEPILNQVFKMKGKSYDEELLFFNKVNALLKEAFKLGEDG